MHLVQHRSVAPAAREGEAATRPAAPKSWSLLLDGARRWGSFDAMVGRYGVRRYRLVVYPPAATPAQRRAARLWRRWSLGGAVLGFLAVMLLSETVASPAVVLTATAGVYLSVGALLFVLAGAARVQVRTLSIVVLPGDSHRSAACAEWRALVKMLTRADELLATGAISAAEYEAKWWKAYGALNSGHAGVRACVPTTPAPRSSAAAPETPCDHVPTRR